MVTLVLITVSAHSEKDRKLVRSAALLFEIDAADASDAAQNRPRAVQTAVRYATDQLNRMWNLEQTATGLIIRHLVVPSKPPWAQFRPPDWQLAEGVQVWVK